MPGIGRQDEGLVTFLVYPPDDLMLVIRIQWLGDQPAGQASR